MKSNHTPGPWQRNGSTVTAKGAWMLTVAICPSLEDPKKQPLDTAAKTLAEAQANVALIAAAPSLAATLLRLAEKVERVASVRLGGGIEAEDWEELLAIAKDAREALNNAIAA